MFNFNCYYSNIMDILELIIVFLLLNLNCKYILKKLIHKYVKFQKKYKLIKNLS